MKTVRRPRAKSIARMGLSRAAVLAFTLLAFVLQTYVTQTHIHIPQTSAVAAGEVKAPAAKAGHGKAPVDNDDPAHCPFCQEMLRAGSFVMPVALLVLLPQQSVSFVPVTLVVAWHVEAVSHGWRGRAPPHA